jgi:hypothetical protein
MDMQSYYKNWTVPGVLGQMAPTYPNPADAASPYINQIPGTITPYYQPYITTGQNAMNTVNTQYGNLINNPTGTMNQIGSTYQQSPGYQYQVDQSIGAANRAAAAGGMLGSPSEQQAVAQNVNQIANQDYYNYVDRGMRAYQMGVDGMQDLNKMGYSASNELAQSLANALMTQAQLGYAGQANQNMANGGSQGAMMGMVGSLASALI